MTFALTDQLIDSIQSAMDNQEQQFLIDAANGCLIEQNELKADEENYYRLPGWNSTEGYNLRQTFVNRLYSPFAKEELQSCLHSGRGVFKNFRTILKKYPEVEKRWYVFRNREMGLFINRWYNSLREIWGLEKLAYVPESDEDLIHDDFSFRDYNSSESDLICSYIHAGFIEEQNDLEEELQSAFYEMWLDQFLNADNKHQKGISCHSLTDDFAGCITYLPVQEKVCVITSLFVPENYRGLGIGTELLSMCFSRLKSDGIKWITLPQIIIPESFLHLLTGMGFEKTGTGYSVRL